MNEITGAASAKARAAKLARRLTGANRAAAVAEISEVERLRLENQKLRKINAALMARVERSMDVSGDGFSLFQTAISLDKEVSARTRDLQQTLTELSQANQRLREARNEAERARQDLANAIDAVEEGFALFGPDDRLVMCNERFRTLLPDLAQCIRPGLSFIDYVRFGAQSSRLAMREGETPESWLRMRLGHHGQAHATFRQGLVGDRWIQVSERRTREGGAAIMQTDITDMVRWERRERDKQLDAQARLIRATLDHLTQGVCVFDQAGALVAWNDRSRDLLGLPYHLLRAGVSVDRLIGYLRKHAMIASRDNAQEMRRWIRSVEPREPLASELRRSDGRILNSYCRTMPDGGFVISFTDVTREREAEAAMRRVNELLEQRVRERTAELTKLNEQLRRQISERMQVESELMEAKTAAEHANLSKTRFLAAASHDLLQPLNAARLFMSSLEETELDAEQGGLVERIDSAFLSVEDILKRLIDISRIDAGIVEPRIAAFPIQSILDPIASEFRAIAEKKGLRLDVAPCSALVVSDRHYLRRIIQNLVANAVRYTSEGRVLVGCRRRGDMLAIEVWDTGVGIDEEDRGRIFEEFQRGRRQEGAIDRGVGLGLAIVERTCRLLGHALTVRSTPAEGSVFSLRVAIAAREADAAPEVGEEAIHGAELSDVIALLVENDRRICDAMVGLLERWGVSVLVATSTREATELAAQLGIPPDVILADFHLDDADTGAAACEELRQLCDHPIPTILITADPSPSIVATARRLGARVLNKPVNPAELRALIQSLTLRRTS